MMRKRNDLRPVRLADRPELEELYLRFGGGDSAHAFASLYLWQEEMDLRLLTGDGVYTLRCGWKGDGAWFFPVGEANAKRDCIRRLMDRGLRRLCYLTEADAAFLARCFPDEFALRAAPEDSEYLYDRREIEQMPGGAFSKIRNRCRRLEKEHSLSVRTLTPELLPTLAEVTTHWKRNTDTGEGLLDTRMMSRVLSDWTALGMQGVLLFLDGTPWAVAAGYTLGNGDFDCCLLKARENLPGVNDHLRAALMRSLDGEITRMNLEEDLGLPGLRLMKELMRPCAKLEMYSGERL